MKFLTFRSVHFHPTLFTRPSFPIFRGSGTETSYSWVLALYTTHLHFWRETRWGTIVHAVQLHAECRQRSITSFLTICDNWETYKNKVKGWLRRNCSCWNTVIQVMCALLEGKKWFSWNFNFVLAHRTSHSQATLPQVTLLSRTSMLNVHTSPLHKVEAKQMLCTSKQPCKIATIKMSCTLQSPAFM